MGRFLPPGSTVTSQGRGFFEDANRFTARKVCPKRGGNQPKFDARTLEIWEGSGT